MKSPLARKILENSVLNLIAGISQRLGQTIIFIFLARLLTQDDTGAFKLANTYTSILLTFSLWGLDQLLIREVAKDKTSLNQYLLGFVGIRSIIAVALWLFLASAMPLLPYSEQSKHIILLFTLTIIPGSLNNLYQAAWIALEKIKKITLLILFFSLFRAIVGLLLLWFTRSVLYISYLFVITYLLELGANIWLTHTDPNFTRFKILFLPSFWITNLKIAIPFIFVSLILIVEYQFDVIILSFYRSESDVAVYGAASTLVTLLLFGTRSFQLAVFPTISQAFENPARLKKIYIKSTLAIVSIALIVITMLSLFSETAIRLIYGSDYLAASNVFSILLWVLLFSALNVPNSRLMVVANQQRVMAIFAMLSMSTSLILSFLLVPRYGGVGSAWARVVAMPFYTVPTIVFTQKKLCPIKWQDVKANIVPDYLFRKIKNNA